MRAKINVNPGTRRRTSQVIFRSAWSSAAGKKHFRQTHVVAICKRFSSLDLPLNWLRISCRLFGLLGMMMTN